MLSLNLRQIMILDHLLENEVSLVDDLLEFLKISSRTLQSEIACINNELMHNEFTCSIASNHNRGYAMDSRADDKASYRLLKNQCKAYLDSEITQKYGDNSRISYLVRRFLTTNDYIKGEEIADEMNISLATLTNDMRPVRTIFESYSLFLQSTPYYGMKVVGDPYAIRSCLLDFCDIYDIYADTYLFEQGAVAQYSMDVFQMKQVHQDIIVCLRKHHIRLSEKGFQRLLFYIVIKLGGYNFFDLTKCTDYDDVSDAYLCAKELGDSFGIESAEELHYLKNLMLASQEYLSPEAIQESVYGDQIEALLSKINHALMNEVHLSLAKRPEIFNVLRSFLYGFLLRKEHHIYEYNGSMKIREVIRDIPVSCSLSNIILELLCYFHGDDYGRYCSTQLTMKLFNAIFIIPNEYEPIRLAFLGPMDAEANYSVAYRLDNYERLNFEKDYFSYYEIDAIDWSLYTCAFIVASTGFNLNSCPIPVYDLNYFVTNEQTKAFFDHVLARHRVENFLVYKADNQVDIDIANKDQKYINEIVKVLQSYEYTSVFGQKVIENLIEDNLQYYDFNPFVICLMWKKELKHTVFNFHLQTPINRNGCKLYTIQIVIMDPNDNVLAIKQADSYVRRMQKYAVL